jgi:hypothetical protein
MEITPMSMIESHMAKIITKQDQLKRDLEHTRERKASLLKLLVLENLSADEKAKYQNVAKLVEAKELLLISKLQVTKDKLRVHDIELIILQ